MYRDRPEDISLFRVQTLRCTVRLLHDYGPKRLGRHVGDTEGTKLAVALDEREHGILLGKLTASAVFGFAADIALVCLDNLVRTSERVGR
jgi:hypothetical protein